MRNLKGGNMDAPSGAFGLYCNYDSGKIENCTGVDAEFALKMAIVNTGN